MIEVSRWDWESTKQGRLSRVSQRRLRGGDDACIQCERMNQGEPRKRAGRPFPLEGREAAWIGGGIPSRQTMLGRGVRSAMGRKHCSLESGFGAMAGQATGLGASGRIKHEAGRDLLLGGERRHLFSAA